MIQYKNNYQYIMRHIDIYGEPLQWYIGNDKTYSTIVGGYRTFLVIGAALIFLFYSVYKLFTERECSYLFYDIVFSDIDETNLIYYKDFEIFFFFQTHGNHMMEMDKNIIRAVIKQTKASDDSSSSSSESEVRNLSSRKKIRNIQINENFNNNNNENFNNNNNENFNNIYNENFNQNSQNSNNNNQNSNNSIQNSNNNLNNNNENSQNSFNNNENSNNNNNFDNNNNNQNSNNNNNNNSNNNENSNNNNNNNNNQNINNEENNSNNEFSSEIPNEIQMSSSTEDDTTISKFIFHECDNNYFSSELGFSSENSQGLSSTYCLNKSELTTSNLNFTLFPLNPLGKSSNPLVFTFEQNCLSQTCTNEENNKYKKVINQIKTVKIFIKSRISNPLNLNNPIQSQVNTFTLTKNHLGSTIYFKNNFITTDSSLIPYFIGAKKFNFLSFDYEKENSDDDALNFYLNFALSNTQSYLIRNYDKLDDALANFIGVFNALEIIGKIFSFFFASFSNEIFIFNYVLKDRIFRIEKNGKNPPKKNVFNYNNNNKNDFNKFNNKNDFDDFENSFVIKNEFVNEKKSISTVFSTKNKEKINNEKFNEKTTENLINSNKILNDLNKNKKNYSKETKIHLNLFKNFWTVILMSLDKEKSKFKDVEDALIKVKLIQNLFDTSIYINIFFDLMRFKKIFFNNKNEEKLFNSIHFTIDEINNYIKMYQQNKEILNKNEIENLIEKFKFSKNKITKNIIKRLNLQLKK